MFSKVTVTLRLGLGFGLLEVEDAAAAAAAAAAGWLLKVGYSLRRPFSLLRYASSALTIVEIGGGYARQSTYLRPNRMCLIRE